MSQSELAISIRSAFDAATDHYCDRGVVYLMLGTKHLAVLAVSLYTLRKYWHGPVTLFADAAAANTGAVAGIALDCDPPIMVVDYQPPPHRAYTVKPFVPAMSHYVNTIQVDADTAWAGPPDPLFDLLKPGLCVVTQFSNWVTTGSRMRGRIEEWWNKDREKVQACLAKPWPALNTGVVAYHRDSRVAKELWLEETLKNPRVFISDEVAMNLLVPFHGPDELLVVGDRFNRSPKFPGKDGEPMLYHFHGRKHTRDERMRAVWLPIFTEMWYNNWGGVRDWLPRCNDGRLHEWLRANPIGERI